MEVMLTVLAALKLIEDPFRKWPEALATDKASLVPDFTVGVHNLLMWLKPIPTTGTCQIFEGHQEVCLTVLLHSQGCKCRYSWRCVEAFIRSGRTSSAVATAPSSVPVLQGRRGGGRGVVRSGHGRRARPLGWFGWRVVVIGRAPQILSLVVVMVPARLRRLLPRRRACERHGRRRRWECRGFAHVQGAHAVVEMILPPYVKRAGIHQPRYFVAPRLLAHAIGPCRVAIQRHGSAFVSSLLIYVHKLVTVSAIAVTSP